MEEFERQIDSSLIRVSSIVGNIRDDLRRFSERLQEKRPSQPWTVVVDEEKLISLYTEGGGPAVLSDLQRALRESSDVARNIRHLFDEKNFIERNRSFFRASGVGDMPAGYAVIMALYAPTVRGIKKEIREVAVLKVLRDGSASSGIVIFLPGEDGEPGKPRSVTLNALEEYREGPE